MAALLLVTVLALLCPARVQPAGVLELRVLSTLGGPGGPCGGPPSCRLIFRLCLRPPRGVGCSLGVAHSPPGPPPAPGAPRILRLPFAFPWPGTVSLIIESWQLEESKGSGGGCQEACAPPGTDSNTCTNGGTCTGHGGDSPGTRCDTPGLGRAPEALAAPAAPAAVLAAPAVAPMAPMVALEAPVAPVVALEAPVAAPVAPAAPATAPETSIPAFSASLLPDGGQLAMPEPLPEVPPSPCALGPCFNGGACAPAPGTGYTCRCPPGFRGFNCERRADRCDDHLCLHGGQCQDFGRGAICKCQPGFSGRRCEHNTDDCTPNPCANGGTCQDGANSFTCSCTLGYTGADCRRRADACASGPCLHGGTCYTHFSGHVCACLPGFMGSRCEEEVGGPPPAPQHRPPVPLALACALPLALLGPGVGLALAARRRRRLMGESRTPETGGGPGTSPLGRERRLPRASATRV
ncbi:delta-like protein 3 isoform X3 [Athene noctua]|uniref:delta-like protein 3 isoform X3 n=1 Tax=Athene noctua TaxID=126797 RepID=UPI003EBFD315